jgi:hypothetical protein
MMDKQDKITLMSILAKMPESDLRTLSGWVDDRLNLLKSRGNRQKALTLEIGDRVQFKDKSGMVRVGRVTKLNLKTVLIDTPFLRWKIDYGFVIGKVSELPEEKGK